MKFQRNEQEVGISINADDERARVTVTGYPKYLRQLAALSAKYPDAYKLLHEERDPAGEVYSRSYSVDKRYIKWGKPASEAQRERGRRLATER